MVLAGTVCFRAATADAQAVSNLFIYPFNLAVSKISTAPSARWGLFRESDTITVSTTDNSSIRVLAMNGSVVYLGPPTTVHLPLGHYFVECNGDRTQFCVLPDDYAGAPFLGSETDNWSDSSAEQRMAAMGITWVRMGQSVWENVETNRNVWDWSSVDKAVAANPGRKIIAMSANLVPSWVGPNEIAPLHTAYVQALATRYKGKLAAIEIWNEPLGGKFSNATNVDSFVNLYLQIFSQARQAIKAVDPTLQVIGPAWTDMPQFESLSMATNPLAAFDGWSWHDYERGFFAPDVDYLSPDLVRSITKDHLEWSFGRFADLPSLFVDEMGLYGRSALGTDTGTNENTQLASPLDWHRGMCRATKMTAMYRAVGLGCILPHVLPLDSQLVNPNFELYGWDVGFRGPHPKTTAFLMTGYWLNGATLVNYLTPGTNVFLYAWQRTNNTSVVFAWAVEGQTVSLINTTLAATDIYGSSIPVSTLTETPVLFQSSSLSAAALLTNVLAALPPGLNLPPVFSPIASQSISKGQTLQFTVTATDPNHYALTYSAAPLPAGASFDPVTGVFSWTPNASQLGTYPITFTARDNPTTSVSISVTVSVVGNLLEGLSNYWKFDANTGTIAADSAGLASGTLSNIPPSGWVAGKYSSALSFNGVSSFVVLPSSVLSLTNNFTVAAWVYPRNAAGAGAFISVRSIYQKNGFRFFIYNNSVFVQGQTTAGWQGSTFDTGNIQNNNWYHVAVVDDNSTILVYVNGVYLGSAYWGGNMVMNSNPFSRIGNDGTQGADYFNGVIDDVMIFNRTLGPSEIALLYQGATQLPVPTTSLKLTGSNAVISFTTVTSATYEVDYRNDLTTGTWLSLTNGVHGTGGILSNTDLGAVSQGKRFYRIVAHY